MNDVTATVLVDGSNVRRSLWPNIPPERLVELCASWSAASDRPAVVVFDRTAPGGLVGERPVSPTCTVVGAGGSADDWIAEAAGTLAAAGRPYWLVTSDRELRRVAGAAAARTIGGGSFARELTTY